MDEKDAGQQGWRQSEVEAFRRLLRAHTRLDRKRLPTAQPNQAPDANGPVRRPLMSLSEPDQPDQPDQPDPASAMASSTPAGAPQLAGALATPKRKPRAWLLLALAVTLMLGLGAGFALGARWTGGTPPSAQAPPSPRTQPSPIPRPRSWFGRWRPRPAWRPRGGATSWSGCSSATSGVGLPSCWSPITWQVANAPGTQAPDQHSTGG